MRELEWEKITEDLEFYKDLVDKKIYDKIEGCFYSDAFKKRISKIRGDWGIPVNGFSIKDIKLNNSDYKKWFDSSFFDQAIDILSKKNIPKVVSFGRSEAIKALDNFPFVNIEKIDILCDVAKKSIFNRGKFDEEILNIAKDFNLFPINIVTTWLDGLVTFNEASLYLFVKELKGANCEVLLEVNPKTTETEIFIKLNEMTTTRDINKVFKIIKKYQSSLKNRKNLPRKSQPTRHRARDYKVSKNLKITDRVVTDTYDDTEGDISTKTDMKRKSTLKKAKQRFNKKYKKDT